MPQLGDLLFDGGKGRAFGPSLRLQAAPIFLRQPLRVVQQRTDFPPDGQIEQVRAHWRILTDALTAKTIRLRPEAAVIGVGAGRAFAGPGAEPFPVVGLPTLLARDGALEQRQRATMRLPGMTVMLPPWLLDGGKHLEFHEGGDRDREPLVLGDIDGRDRPAGLEGAPALGPQARTQGLPAPLPHAAVPLDAGFFHTAPETILRSQTVFPVRVTSPARC